MPSLDPQQIIETQRQDWTRVAPGWEKWDESLDHNMAFMNYRLVGEAHVRPGQRILDLGSGTGYPALLAAQAVGPRGNVVGLDLADAMLDVARRKAKALGLTNIRFQAGDVSTLPFDAGSFDAVISRFCLMFLPDVPKAAAEIARVLKPGGYLAAAVWSLPEKNPFLNIPINIVKQFIDIPPPEPDQPGIFRLAKPGDLRGIVERAGLTPLADETVSGESLFASGQEYVSSLMDIAAPFQALFAKLSSSQQTQTQADIKRAVQQYEMGGKIALPIEIRIVVGRKGR
ncbi:MAG TPA: methyltransferase domain-containing protein [Nitrospiraceae bacterium]|jgi:ubiquinone/menaquinone biosynthesis C-methylase UbiE|nr:methyltransferase domain-containing protein [Nitrospiraceae bacterium]